MNCAFALSYICDIVAGLITVLQLDESADMVTFELLCLVLSS